DSPRARTLAFGKDQNRPALLRQLADIPDGFARAGLGLRNRKSVDEQRRESVDQAVRPPLAPRMTLGMEMRVEELLPHSRSYAVSPAARQARQDDRRIEMALVIGGENHRSRKRPQVFQARNLSGSDRP